LLAISSGVFFNSVIGGLVDVHCRTPEDEIEAEVDALRAKLIAQGENMTNTRKQFKPSDTHAILEAKRAEMERVSRAFGTSLGYVEGQAFDPAHAEEMKQQRIARREEKEREGEIRRKAREDNEKAWKEKERLRRRAEDQTRGGGRGVMAPPKGTPLPPSQPRERRERSRSPPPREASRPKTSDNRGARRDRSPPPRRPRSPPRSRSISFSPPPKIRRKSTTSPRRRGASPSNRGRTSSRSPPSERSKSWSPRNRNRRDISMSRSRSKSRSSSGSRSRSPRSRSAGRRRRSYSRSRSSRSRSRSYSPPRYQGGRGRGNRRYSPPRRGGNRGNWRGGGNTGRYSPQQKARRALSRSRSVSRDKRGPSPITGRKRSRSRSASHPGETRASKDTRMRSRSPPKAEKDGRSASPAKSDGSAAMDESD
jgi:serine/arginine repetitive matrix protein 2